MGSIKKRINSRVQGYKQKRETEREARFAPKGKDRFLPLGYKKRERGEKESDKAVETEDLI